MLFKKIISFIFALIVSLSGLFSQSLQTVPVTAEGAIFGGADNDAIQMELKFDTKWITANTNKIYNSALASFSVVLCDDIYYRAKDLAKGTQNRVLVNGAEDAYAQTALLEKLGYTDVKYIESFKQKSYAADSNDSVTMLMAYKNVDNKYDSFIFVLRGCFSAGERLSTFDIGSDTDAYTALTGAHTEWTNKAVCKGLDVAANRAMEFIDEYIAAHDVPECRNTALTTGHSRGASLANIIGAKLEDDESVKSYTYTFNTMPFTTDKEAVNYKTIFNLFDENDFYSNPIPFGREQMYRYGQDITLNIAGSDKVKEEIAALKGRSDYTCLAPETKAEYDKLFGEAFPDRASLYQTKTLTVNFATAEEMNAAAEALRKNASDLGIAAFVQVETDETENTVTLTYCGAALLYCLAQIQCYGEAAYDVVVSLFRGDDAYCRLAEIMQNGLAGAAGGHLLINSYILAKHMKYLGCK